MIEWVRGLLSQVNEWMHEWEKVEEGMCGKVNELLSKMNEWLSEAVKNMKMNE